MHTLKSPSPLRQAPAMVGSPSCPAPLVDPHLCQQLELGGGDSSSMASEGGLTQLKVESLGRGIHQGTTHATPSLYIESSYENRTIENDAKRAYLQCTRITSPTEELWICLEICI